jgi:hypothetical protein
MGNPMGPNRVDGGWGVGVAMGKINKIVFKY